MYINHSDKKAFIVFFITTLLAQSIAYRIYYVEKENDQLMVKQEAIYLKNQLESALNHSVIATKTLAFLVEEDLLGDYFDSVSNKLISKNKYIDALQLVEGYEIINTYPRKGNEVTIGYKVMKVPQHFKEAQKALERDEVYFEGPIALKQGGMGMVGRYPIFKNNKLWGFAAAIVRLNTFLKAINIDSTGENETYYYQLAKYEDNAQQKQIVFPNNQDFNSGVFYTSFVPMGDWKIYVKLKNPGHLNKALIFAIFGLLIAGLLALYVRNLLMQPLELQNQIDEKTKDLHELNEALKNQAHELKVSNDELQQFAYVASHDLQEPLRMITSFLERLDKKYSDTIDNKGKQYIFYAIDGARRMRQIILALLEYSRVGRSESQQVDIDLNELVTEYQTLRKSLITEKNAIIHFDNLPTIKSHRAAIIQVFHNLLDNGLRYHRQGVPPEIHITFAEQAKYWEFSFHDNGIGIEKEYHDKIFVLFQRLKEKQDTGGTGMGLAIVKKIIEHLKGNVWLSSVHGKGSVFYFTIPKQ